MFNQFSLPSSTCGFVRSSPDQKTLGPSTPLCGNHSSQAMFLLILLDKKSKQTLLPLKAIYRSYGFLLQNAGPLYPSQFELKLLGVLFLAGNFLMGKIHVSWKIFSIALFIILERVKQWVKYVVACLITMYSLKYLFLKLSFMYLSLCYLLRCFHHLNLYSNPWKFYYFNFTVKKNMILWVYSLHLASFYISLLISSKIWFYPSIQSL